MQQGQMTAIFTCDGGDFIEITIMMSAKCGVLGVP